MKFPSPVDLPFGPEDRASADALLFLLAAHAWHGSGLSPEDERAVQAFAPELLCRLPLVSDASVEAALDAVEVLDLARCALEDNDLTAWARAAERALAAATWPDDEAARVLAARARGAGRGRLRPWTTVGVAPPAMLLDAWVLGQLVGGDSAAVRAAVAGDDGLRQRYRARLERRLERLEVLRVTDAWAPDLYADTRQPLVRVPLPHLGDGAAMEVRRMRSVEGSSYQLVTPSNPPRLVRPGRIDVGADPLLGTLSATLVETRGDYRDRERGLYALELGIQAAIPEDRLTEAFHSLAEDLRGGRLHHALEDAAAVPASASLGAAAPELANLAKPAYALAARSEASGAVLRLQPEATWEEWVWLALAIRLRLQDIADARDDYDLLLRLGDADDACAPFGPALTWIGEERWAEATEGMLPDQDAWWGRYPAVEEA